MSRVTIGPLGIGAIPRIVGSAVSAAVLARLPRLVEEGVDIVEVRADLLGADEDWLEASARAEAAGLPVLLTARSSQEGGGWEGTEEARGAVYESGLDRVSACDVEIGSRLFSKVAAGAHRRKKTVIGSFHDFEKTPDKRVLRRVIQEGRGGGADIIKLATMINGREDIITLYELLRDTAGGPLCVIGMGVAGIHTRVGLACTGSCLTYGFIDRSAAPGQISCLELAKRLRESGCRPE